MAYSVSSPIRAPEYASACQRPSRRSAHQHHLPCQNCRGVARCARGAAHLGGASEPGVRHGSVGHRRHHAVFESGITLWHKFWGSNFLRPGRDVYGFGRRSAGAWPGDGPQRHHWRAIVRSPREADEVGPSPSARPARSLIHCTHRQPQARQVELALLRIAPIIRVRQNYWRQRAHLLIMVLASPTWPRCPEQAARKAVRRDPTRVLL